MRIKSLPIYIGSLFVILYLGGVFAVLRLADAELKEVLQESHIKGYRERVERILAILDKSFLNLQATGETEISEKDFQDRIIRDLRLFYYTAEDMQMYPVLIKKNGEIVMHPYLKKGDNIFAAFPSLASMLTPNDGNFFFTDDKGQRMSCLFKHYKPWNWKVAVIASEESFYGDAHAFENRMLFHVLVSVILFGAIISFVVAKLMRPVISLREEARFFVAGDLNNETEVPGKDEIEELGRYFVLMKEKLRKKISDLSEKKSELQESELRFCTLLQQAADVVFVHDTAGCILDANDQACKSLNYSREELLKLRIQDIDLMFYELDNMELFLDTIKPLQPITQEGSYRRKNGSIFPVEVRIGVMELAGHPAFLAIARDISDRIKELHEKNNLQAQLFHAQKMEAIGTLSGGIAHDFNNILTPIIGYSELIRSRLPADSELLEDLDVILISANRAKELVKQILIFSRQNNQERHPLKIDTIIKEVLKLLRAIIPANIEIRQNIEEGCGYILASPCQIHQVVMNLCTNAYHAMRDRGGILGLSLSQVNIEEETALKKLDFKPGLYVRLEVSDNGHGINPEVLPRILDPYFTTKAQGEGTGLGLSVVHGIIKGQGGHISVYSEPEKGTTFHVYFPCIEGEEEKEAEQGKEIPTGTEHIMVIDDEDIIVRTEKVILEMVGYRVTGFIDPFKALQAFREFPDNFDLVITDMTMPDMVGVQLAAEILAIRPTLPIILCTGFSEIINAKQAKKAGIREYVMKPVTGADLARIVRKVLDG